MRTRSPTRKFMFLTFHFSSNINEVIKTVLNFLLFFYEKILHAQKSTKKHRKALKAQKAQKRNQEKALKRK